MSSDDEPKNPFSDEDEEWVPEEDYIDYLQDLAEEYDQNVQEQWERSASSKEYLSKYFILSSLFSGFSIIYASIFLSDSILSYTLYLIIGVLFGIVAIGLAFGIVRWTLFEIISTTNALRQ